MVRARMRKRTVTSSCTWIAPPNTDSGAIAKSVCFKATRPATASESALRSSCTGTCRVRVTPCSVSVTCKPASPPPSLAAATLMRAKGYFVASSPLSMFRCVPAMSSSVGCVSNPASARSASSSTIMRSNRTYRSARPALGITNPSTSWLATTWSCPSRASEPPRRTSMTTTDSAGSIRNTRAPCAAASR